jgi:dihydrodipicolinate synthase/N-acetylneuraminate lyase
VFKKNNTIDSASFAALVDYYIQKGSSERYVIFFIGSDIWQFLNVPEKNT